MKSKEQVKEDLNLDELPDDEFMDLLDEVGQEEIVSGVSPVEDDGYTPDEVREELAEAMIADSLGETLSKAREQAGLSLREAADVIGISHSRIQQLESSENLEIETLARVAAGLGFKATLNLEPDQSQTEKNRPIIANLTEAFK